MKRNKNKIKGCLSFLLVLTLSLALTAPIPVKADDGQQTYVIRIDDVDYTVKTGAEVGSPMIRVPDSVDLSDNLNNCKLWVVSVDGNPLTNVGNKSGVKDSQDRDVLEIQTQDSTKTQWTGNLNYHAEDDPVPGNQKYGFQLMMLTIMTESSDGGLFKNIDLSKTTFTYTGKAIKPQVTVRTSWDYHLSPEDYELYYSGDCIKVGVYTVTATGKGDFEGSKISAEFTIVPAGTTISKLTPGKGAFTVKLKKNTTQTTGYQIRYCEKGGKWKTVKISKNSTTSMKISSLKANTAYQVQVRTYKTVSGKSYYSSWSAAKSVKTK